MAALSTTFGPALLKRVPIGPPMRSMVRPSWPADASRRVAELIATQVDTIAAEAGGCDALLATGMSHFAARSAGEALGTPYVYATFSPVVLPSPHHAPLLLLPPPPEGSDNRVLWELNAQSCNALRGPELNAHRVSIGLPLVDDALDFILTDHPWLAADPTLGPWHETPDLDVVWTGAWILPDERPLPAELVEFLDAGAPPVYVGFGSMRRRRRGQPAGTVRPGGRRRAPRRRGHDDDGRPGRRRPPAGMTRLRCRSR